MNAALSYNSPHPWNLEKTSEYRASDCAHYLQPSESVLEAFRGPLHHDGYVHALNSVRRVLDGCTFEVQQVVVDVKARTVAMRLKATYAFKAIGDDEPAEKGYTAEYVYLIEIDESGKKIVKFDEFLDPQRLLGYVFGKAESRNQSHGEAQS